MIKSLPGECEGFPGPIHLTSTVHEKITALLSTSDNNHSKPPA